MAASDVSICNLALARIGQKAIIQSLTENSRAAQVCNVLYAPARDAVLQAFPWPFASTFKTLAVATAAPQPPWVYAYGYPSDCLLGLRIHPTLDSPGATAVYSPVGYTPSPQDETEIPFRVANISGQRVILCDLDQAVLEYTMAITNAASFSPLFAEALSWRIATDLAMSFAVADSIRQRSEAVYTRVLAVAQAVEANQRTPRPQQVGATERARG